MRFQSLSATLIPIANFSTLRARFNADHCALLCTLPASLSHELTNLPCLDPNICCCWTEITKFLFSLALWAFSLPTTASAGLAFFFLFFATPCPILLPPLSLSPSLLFVTLPTLAITSSTYQPHASPLAAEIFAAHKFCGPCAEEAVLNKKAVCYVCSRPVARVLLDPFAESLYKERVKYVDEKLEMERRTAARESEAKERLDAERAELLRDAELKHRQALEDQFHQQEELTRQIEARHREETQSLNEKLAELQLAKDRATNAQQQADLEKRMKAEADAVQRRYNQDQVDLGASLAHFRARREAADNAIRGQLQEELGRSLAGKVREDHNHLRNSAALGIRTLKRGNF